MHDHVQKQDGTWQMVDSMYDQPESEVYRAFLKVLPQTAVVIEYRLVKVRRGTTEYLRFIRTSMYHIIAQGVLQIHPSREIPQGAAGQWRESRHILGKCLGLRPIVLLEVSHFFSD